MFPRSPSNRLWCLERNRQKFLDGILLHAELLRDVLVIVPTPAERKRPLEQDTILSLAIVVDNLGISHNVFLST